MLISFKADGGGGASATTAQAAVPEPAPRRRNNLPFARWGDVFGDQTVAAAMIDRIVHHADVHTLKGGSYRLKHITDETLPSIRLAGQAH